MNFALFINSFLIYQIGAYFIRSLLLFTSLILTNVGTQVYHFHSIASYLNFIDFSHYSFWKNMNIEFLGPKKSEIYPFQGTQRFICSKSSYSKDFHIEKKKLYKNIFSKPPLQYAYRLSINDQRTNISIFLSPKLYFF